MIDHTNTVGLDFETYSDVVLKDHGTARYMASPYFQPLLGKMVIVDENGQCKTVQAMDFVSTSLGTLRRQVQHTVAGKYIVCHHTAFEQGVLSWMGLEYPASRFIDSEVIARVAGGGGRLEAAAAQLLDEPKDSNGHQLIKMFSVPTKAAVQQGDLSFNTFLPEAHPEEWELFGDYCQTDAFLGLKLVLNHVHMLGPKELEFAAITMQMNQHGWPVDMDMVSEMRKRYEENKVQALDSFRSSLDEYDLNLNSYPQQKKWCAERGVNINSFDKDNVAALIPMLKAKINTTLTQDPKYQGYTEVLTMLETKQILGGTSLSKLDKLVAMTNKDGRLRNQYAHCGAAQTLRTSGRGVQMQNLKRLDTQDLGDMDELLMEETDWTNEKLADNLRQVFTASHEDGLLFVGDFSSVEARGLAYLAGEEDVLNGFRQGLDLYKVMAAKIFDVQYSNVTKAQRQVGKVGVLSCGYGAGDGAVKDFAQKMGVEMSQTEAAKLVVDWRAANPAVVQFWWDLDDMLHRVVEEKVEMYKVLANDGLQLILRSCSTPASLLKLHPGAQSVEMELQDRNGKRILSRYFHGCYVRGRNICYYKPSDRETGDLWRGWYMHPKTKVRAYYSLYGGKLTGIMVQSLCREIFMHCLLELDKWASRYANVEIIGQFHDEIVVDCWPNGTISPDDYETRRVIEQIMSSVPWLPSFPLEAEVKSAYRYTK